MERQLRLRALIALAEDLALVLSAHVRRFTTACYYSSTALWLPWHLQAHGSHHVRLFPFVLKMELKSSSLCGQYFTSWTISPNTGFCGFFYF